MDVKLLFQRHFGLGQYFLGGKWPCWMSLCCLLWVWKQQKRLDSRGYKQQHHVWAQISESWEANGNWASPLVSIHELACAAIKANLKSCSICSGGFCLHSPILCLCWYCVHIWEHIFLPLDFEGKLEAFLFYSLWQNLLTLLKDKFEE